MSFSVEKAAQVAGRLGKQSYWVSPNHQVVFGVFVYNDYAIPNHQFPFQLRIGVYQPSADYLADQMLYLGGVGLDGSLSMTEVNNSFVGYLRDNNTIVWNNGMVWQRTQLPEDNSVNQYSAESAYQQAAVYSDIVNRGYNQAYPRPTKWLP